MYRLLSFKVSSSLHVNVLVLNSAASLSHTHNRPEDIGSYTYPQHHLPHIVYNKDRMPCENNILVHRKI